MNSFSNDQDGHYEKLLTSILANKSLDELKESINLLHPAKIADLLESLPENKREAVWKLVRTSFKGEVLLEVHDTIQKQLIEITSDAELKEALKGLQLDELVDLENLLPHKVIDDILNTFSSKQRRQFKKLREYPSDSAGGLMDMDAIVIRSDISLAVVLRYLRQYRYQHSGLPEHLDSIIVIGRDNHYLGELPLKDLVSLPVTKKVSDVMNKEMKPINVHTKANEIARIFEDNDLFSAAIVDDHNHLLGRITIDDVVDFIREESEQRLMSPVGLSKKAELFSSVVMSVKDRSLWLGLNLINAFLAALVISLFSKAIERVVILAVLMPVVASMSGVVGNQALTLVTRGIALDQVGEANSKLVLSKEAFVGIVNGVIWGVLVAFVSWIWFQKLKISFVFALAMFLSIFFSTTAGTLIPMILNKLKIDPALGGGVMIAAVSDLLGFFIFLGIASLVLF